MKTFEDIIDQYLPDGEHSGLNHFNENKVKRMMEQACSIKDFNNGTFSHTDIIKFCMWKGIEVNETDIKQWINDK